MKCLFLTLFFSLLVGCTKKNGPSTPISTPKDEATKLFLGKEMKTTPDGLSIGKCLLKTVHGNLVIKLYPQKAPHTVTRFLELVTKGFYDGLTFHRVLSNYLIQTGDPTQTGTGGSGVKLKAEFNDIPHIRGTLAMARDEGNPDSADSQFYISLTSLSHLDGKFTVFGQVVEGIAIIDKIVKGDKILSLSFSE